MNQQAIPTPALLLGIGGLIPFVAATVMIGLDESPSVAWQALLAYGAVILSFLGAVHWGLILDADVRGHGPDNAVLWRRLGWGVIPALLAWVALLLPAKMAVALLLLGFAAQYGMDWRLTAEGALPGWYGRLRLGLTTGVIVCLLIAWAI